MENESRDRCRGEAATGGAGGATMPGMIAIDAAAGRDFGHGITMTHAGVVVPHRVMVMTLGGRLVHHRAAMCRAARRHGHPRQALERHGDSEEYGNEEPDNTSH